MPFSTGTMFFLGLCLAVAIFGQHIRAVALEGNPADGGPDHKGIDKKNPL
jgi:hypothetical protein